jgi:hypothetical protein
MLSERSYSSNSFNGDTYDQTYSRINHDSSLQPEFDLLASCLPTFDLSYLNPYHLYEFVNDTIDDFLWHYRQYRRHRTARLRAIDTGNPERSPLLSSPSPTGSYMSLRSSLKDTERDRDSLGRPINIAKKSVRFAGADVKIVMVQSWERDEFPPSQNVSRSVRPS